MKPGVPKSLTRSDAMRAGRPEVKPVVQVTCEIAGVDPNKAVVAARGAILDWLRDKQRITSIPQAAWAGEPFEIDASQDRPVLVEAFEDIWALRFDNPDSEIHGRQWRTEAIIGKRDAVALLGVRLTVISRTWDIPFFPSVPRVILDLAEKSGLRDYGSPLQAEPWLVESSETVTQLVDLLELPKRTRPVFVVSTGQDDRPIIDTQLLAQRTAGLAHVVKLTPNAAWQLSEDIGSTQSVFGSAIRTYQPGFDRYAASWGDHPVATRDWLDRRFPDRARFLAMLVEKAISASVLVPNLEERLPSFTRVRQALSRRRLEAVRRREAGATELLTLYEADNEKLREDLQAAEDLLEERGQAHRLLEDERDQVARQNHGLRARVMQLEAWHSQRGESEAIEYPRGYEELDEWVSRYLAGRLILLPRALRSVKKAEFRDIKLLCECLSLLGLEYRDMRLGKGDRNAFESAMQRQGVEVSPTGNQAMLLQWRNEYEVIWNRERRFLDMHLKKGASREPRACLRVYFFWDEDGEQIVVGHLPDHLTTAVT